MTNVSLLLSALVPMWALPASAAEAPPEAAERPATPAEQTLADLDRMARSPLELSDASRAELLHDQAVAADVWLREHLGTVPNDSSDLTLAHLQQLIAEAARRERLEVADQIEAMEVALLKKREPELGALIENGKWLQALQVAAMWTNRSRKTSGALGVLERTRAQVRAAIDAAATTASSPQELFLYSRMKRWLGDPDGTGPEYKVMRALLAQKHTFDFGKSACPEAQSVTLNTAEGGTPVTLTFSLGPCEVAEQRASRVPRQQTYFVPVEHEKDEEYVEYVDVTRSVPTYEKKCEYKRMDLSTSGAHSYADVLQCNSSPTYRTETTREAVTRVRRVKFLVNEGRTESFFADTIDRSVTMAVTLSVTGDGSSVSRQSTLNNSVHDEQYSRVHGASQSFTGGLDVAVKKGLQQPLTALAREALEAWNRARAAARLAAARKSPSKSEARSLAVEAIALDPGNVAAAASLVALPLGEEQLKALVSGKPEVPQRSLPSPPPLKLPPPNQQLEDQYALLEGRQATLKRTENRDVMVGLGVGLLPTPDRKASGAFAIEFQIGYVPTVSAISNLLLRAEVDTQIFATKFAQLDLGVRPEIGYRLGPVHLSAVGVAGFRVAFFQADVDPEEDGRFGAFGYLGYGPHVSLHLGPVLVDAMMLRQHQLGAVSPIATRADAIIGGGTDSFFVIARLRYVAQADFLQMFQAVDRIASLTFGIMLQF